jgi:molybdate transport system ATP-binding protein
MSGDGRNPLRGHEGDQGLALPRKAPVERRPFLEVDITLPVGAGEQEIKLESDALSVAVFGPSGGGKSTFLRTLAGVERRSSGKVRFGREVWLDSEREIFVPPWERSVGWVPQDYLLFPHLRVRDNLGYGGGSPQEIADMAALLFVDHLLDRRPRRLSGGEQQRVALGRALLSRPKILLLDEPFSALDRPLRNRVGSQIGTYMRAREIPLILVSHDEADAAALAQEHWMLSQGRLVRVEG